MQFLSEDFSFSNSPRARAKRVLLVSALLAGGLLAWSPPLQAQGSDLQSLSDQVSRLQRELQDLQKAFYNGEAPAAGVGSSSGQDLTNVQAARINLRLSQFETAMRTLTNQVEEMGFAVDRANQRIDRLVADVDNRLRALEGGQPASTVTAPSDAAQKPSGADSDQGGGQMRIIGTVSQDDVESFQGTRVEPSDSVASEGQAAMAVGAYKLPEGSVQDQYKHAFGLLRQANYAEAEQALQAFIDRYPDDPLAGNAQYWLGETYYVRGDYQQAAVTFAEAYKNYPDGAKAADNLLKLGLSLASLGNETDACGTFSELMRRYPDSSPGIVRRAKTESQKLSCP
jgi:tol-pal system protein YbgF